MKNLTAETLDLFEDSADWLGFGYIGARVNQRGYGAEADYNVARADQMLLDHANRLGLTADELFDWANSKAGRWYGDCWFGANGRQAEKLLPTK